jgi:hypothetical protein
MMEGLIGPMSEKARLELTVQRLYQVFGRYHAPTDSSFCRHCVESEEDELLRSKPLRQLSATELARYSFKAISTWGTVDLFKYLLPRLFETIASEKYRYDPEVLFKKPRYGGFENWLSDERASLIDYCNAVWEYALSDYPIGNTLPAFPSIDDCLCSIAQVVDDLTPLLDRWNAARNAAAIEHLADFADENVSALKEVRKLSNSFWKNRGTQMQQVIDWFFCQEFAMPIEISNIAPTRILRSVPACFDSGFISAETG